MEQIKFHEVESSKDLEVNLEDEILCLQQSLYRWFKHTYEGRITLDKLYEKGLEISDKIRELYPDFSDKGDMIDLRATLAFIDNLHDSSTRKHHSEHNEQIYYHMTRLS